MVIGLSVDTLEGQLRMEAFRDAEVALRLLCMKERRKIRKEREMLAQTHSVIWRLAWGLGRSWNDNKYCSSQEFLLPSWYDQDRLETGKLKIFPAQSRFSRVLSLDPYGLFVFGPWLENHRKKGWDTDKSLGGGGAAAFLLLLWFLCMEFLCKWTCRHPPICPSVSVHPPIVHWSICPSFHITNTEHVLVLGLGLQGARQMCVCMWRA